MAIGPFSFDSRATAAQKEVIRPALEQVVDTPIAARLKTIWVVPKRSSQMPDWNSAQAGVQPAWELWKGYNSRTQRRELWYWDQLHTKDECVATILHGVIHAYDEYYLTGEMRAAIMDLMHPRPEAYFSGRSWSRFPYECTAVYGSAAVFGLTKPVYKRLLDRHIYSRDWPKLKAILLG